IDVVQDDGFMPVLVSLEINTKRSGLAADPADLASQRLADRAAFADSRRAEDHEQVQMSRAEGADVRLQLSEGRKVDGMGRQTWGLGHGGTPQSSATRRAPPLEHEELPRAPEEIQENPTRLVKPGEVSGRPCTAAWQKRLYFELIGA